MSNGEDHTWTKRGGQDATEQMEKYRELPDRQVVRMSGAEYEALLERSNGLTGDALTREWTKGDRER